MGRGYRWTTQLGVAEKFVNGHSVGFQVGFVCGDSFMCSIRRNVVFATQAEAEKILESLESNTQQTRKTHKIVSRGMVRFPGGDGYKDNGSDRNRWR